MFNSNLQSVVYSPLLFAFAVLLFTTFGWLFGRYRLKVHKNENVIVRDPLMAAIFGLTALVLGFTFSGSASRYFAQIDSMRNQAQALYKVYGSLKYLAPSDQLEVRESLDELLEIRLKAFANIRSMADVDMQLENILAAVRKIQEKVIIAAANAPAKNQPLILAVLMPQVKDLSVAISAGNIGFKSHPPTLLMRFLFGLLCVTAFLIGYTMAVKKENDWLLAAFYTTVIGVTLYVILSLEFPNLLMPYEEINRDFLLLKDAVK